MSHQWRRGEMYYPSTPRQAPHDKYEGVIPVVVPPPLTPTSHQNQHHQQYSPYPHHSRGAYGGAPVPWSSGLCHCCDDPANCIITAICPCITFGQIAEIINRGEPTCTASGAIYALLLGFTGFACLFSCFHRSKLRARYDLEESPFADCLVHFCCETCALCQEYRELKARGFDMGIGRSVGSPWLHLALFQGWQGETWMQLASASLVATMLTILVYACRRR